MTFWVFLINLSLGGAAHKTTFFDLRNWLALFVLHLFKKSCPNFLSGFGDISIFVVEQLCTASGGEIVISALFHELLDHFDQNWYLSPHFQR